MQRLTPKNLFGSFLLVLGLMAMASPAIAVDKFSREAPNQQDYYSTVNPDVSDAALVKADTLRMKTITSIKAILKSPKTKKNRKFELYLRLGELYGERHDYLRDKEYKKYDADYAKWLEKGKKGKEPKLNDKKSQRELRRAVNSFRKLVKTFPKHKRTDAALYSLGKTLARMGNANSILYFEQLVKDHKRSKLLPETYLAMAEYYFDKQKLDDSIKNYKKVLKYKKHKVYPYAVYKLGWAYFNASGDKNVNTKKYISKSTSAFKLVIKLAERGKEKAGFVDLKDEAVKDLVMVWAETENIKDAWAYFKSIDQKKQFYNMLALLGDIYLDNGKHDSAIKVFARLIKEAPTREDNPSFHAKLVDLYANKAKLSSVTRELAAMSQLYVKGSPWTIKNAKNKEAITTGKEKTETYLHRYSTLYHQKGQKTNNKSYLTTAEKLYETYLATFPKEKNAYHIKFYLADIKYEFKKYDSAANYYTEVAKDKSEKQKYLKSAAYNAVLAMNKLDQQQKYSKLPKSGKVEKPIPLPKVKQKFVSVIDNYTAWLPKEKDGHPMRYTAAQIFYDYGHYDEAVKRFASIAEELPQTVQGKGAVGVVLQHYAKNKDWVNTISWSRRFNKSKAIAKAGHKKFIVGILKTAMFNRAADLEKKKSYTESAKAYLGFQSEFPKDKNADIALFNASVNFYKVGAVENALAAGKKVLDKYPKSKTVPQVLLNSAQTYESLAQFDQAAKYYERFALNNSKRKEASGALYNAAVLTTGLHKFDKATKLFEKFVAKFPKSELVTDAYLEVAKLKERQKDYKGAVKAYAAYGARVKKAPEANLFAQAKVAELNMNHVSRKSGTKQVQKLAKILKAKNSPNAFEARSLVAKLSFEMVNSDFEAYKRVKLNDADKIETQVKKKQKGLVKLAKDYQDIIEIGNGEYTVASLYRLGEMHELFASGLINVPDPANASQLEIDNLRTELEKVAFPLKEQAYKYYETAHTRSAEVVTLSEWTKMSYNKMSELNPDNYPEVLEKVADAEYLGHRLGYDKAVAEILE